MFFRTLALAGGLFGAVGFSQFPEYSQQYTQRLAGAVDELSGVVGMFDADAAKLGMTREEALADMAGAGGMAAARALSMRQVFYRHDKLSSDLNALRVKTPVGQLTQAWRMTDVDVARKAWDDFRPAMPVTMDGIGFGVAGFLAGMVAMAGFLTVGRILLGRRRAAP